MDFAFKKRNYILLIIGLIFIIIGFILMSGGKSEDPTVFLPEEIFSFQRITLATILVMAGFVIEIFAVMHKGD